eukprot:9211432-Lingulodinium_polyedra.AAC.1
MTGKGYPGPLNNMRTSKRVQGLHTTARTPKALMNMNANKHAASPESRSVRNSVTPGNGRIVHNT